MNVWLRDARRGDWLEFRHAEEVVCARRLDEVCPALQRVDAAVTGGKYAAGFVAYEAAPAFDPALRVRHPGDVPLVWFVLCASVTRHSALPAAPAAVLPHDWTPTLEASAYLRSVRQIRQWIRSGDTYQVNFTYRLRTACTADPWSLFVHYTGPDPVLYSGYIETEDWAICSLSPELFFQLDGAKLVSRPMKGTAARGRWHEEDLAQVERLRASAKERAENVMIVDMVRNDMGRICRAGRVRVPELYAIERYPTIWQMTSTVEGDTDASLEGIFRALFPPASITGAPKVRTMELITGLEQDPRGIYTGAMGWLLPGRQAQFNVAIRTLWLDRHRGQAEYGVGSGIVWDSDALRERRECATKARVLHAPASDFDLLETLRWEAQGGIFLLQEHLERLHASAEYFGRPVDVDAIRRMLHEKTEQLSGGVYRLRLRVSRRGNATLECTPLPPEARTFCVPPCSMVPVDSSDPFLFHKTTRRDVYRHALNSVPGAQDVLLYNERGEITETTIANVAFKRGGRWITPPVASGLLAGTCRQSLLREGRIQEQVVPCHELEHVHEILLMNAVRGAQKLPFRVTCGS